MKDDLRKPWYLGGALYDSLLIVGAPLVACAIVGSVLPNRANTGTWLWPNVQGHWLPFWALVLTFLHVNIGFARSHLNQKVFVRHKVRFIAVPILVALALSLSSNLFIWAAFFALFWDELHSAFQTFGFGRLYDSRLKNDPHVGRTLDRWFCVIIEWIPHVVLVSFMAESELIQTDVDYGYPDSLVGITAAVAGYIRYPIVMGSLLFVAYYVYKYVGYVRNGYRISGAKIALYASTFFAAMYAVTCHTLVGIAVLTNIYHAVQYIAIVWLTEQDNLQTRLSLASLKAGAAMTLLLLLGASGGLAYARASGVGMPWFAGAWTTLTLMHFWYDGFIWSVRQSDVKTHA